MTARDYILNMLSATRTHADAEALVAEVEAATRNKIAAEFEVFGKTRDRIGWGEAREIALSGLCSCQGGTGVCPRVGGSRG